MNKAQSFLKKTLQVILWVAAFTVLVLVIILSLIQIPAIQNKIVHSASAFISNKTNTRVEVKKIYISFPKSVTIKGLFLEDIKSDTLLYAGEAKINISIPGLFRNKINVNSFVLEDLVLNLKRAEKDSLFNFNFLQTAFRDTVPQIRTEPQTKSKWIFNVNRLTLKNIRVHYDDEYGGMNIASVLGNLKLKMNEIDLDKSIYSIDDIQIESLNANILKKQSNAGTKKSDNVLLKITANKIQISNSLLSYGDSISKQSINALINRFGLEEGSVDLQKEIVSTDKVYLSKSEIRYSTIDKGLQSDTTLNISNAIAEKSDWIVSVKRIDLDDNSLAYTVANKPVIKKAFDVNHMDFKHLILTATDFYYSRLKTEVSVKKFTVVDHNNFSVTKFETEFSMDQHSITTEKLKVTTANSSIDADLNIQFSSLESLKDSLPHLTLDFNLKNVSIKNNDIVYFNNQLLKQEFFKYSMNVTTVSGIVNGPLNHLNGKNLVIKTGYNTILKTDFIITGLPDIRTANYNFPDLNIVSGKRDIEMMAESSIPESIELPENVSIQAVFKGQLKSFESTMSMGSSYGPAQLFAKIDNNENFRSKVNITNFDLGGLLKDKAMYGPVTITAEASGHGLDKNTIKAKINAEVSKIYLNNYTYHNLIVDGNIRGQEFAGKIKLNDENAVFDFDGLGNFNPDQEQYKFRLDVQGADLQKLNLTNDDLRIALVATADLTGGALNNLNGKASISNLIIAKGDKKYALDSLLFASINEPNKSEFNFSSALISLKYSGTISPIDLSGELNNFMSNYFPFSDNHQLTKRDEPSNFNFEIQLHNHPILSQILLPQLKEFEPGIIQGSFDSEKNDLKLNATLNKIVYGTSEINDFVVDVTSDPAALNYKISSSDVSNAQIKLDNLLLDGKIADKTIFASVSSIADNKNKKIVIRSQITKVNNNYKLVLDPEDFYLMNNRWDIASDNYIEFGKEGFLIHNFFINNDVSQVNITSLNDQFNDDLNIGIKNFKLDDISRIIEKDTSLVKGSVDGNVLLKRVNETYGIIADVEIKNLFIRDIPIGDLTVKAENPTAAKFVIDVNLTGADNNLIANGYFIPQGGDNSISIKTAIQSLSMKTVEAFSMGQITEGSGTLSGNFSIQGATSAPEITGELVFNNAFVKPAVLNNMLELKNETIQFKPDGIYFNSFTLVDEDNNTAIIDGAIQMKQFKDFIFALQVNTVDFLLMNTTFRANKNYYGRMIIDSRININGPLMFPVVNGRLKMNEGSNFTFAVPEDKLTTDKGEDVVEFEDSLKLNSILSRVGETVIKKANFRGFDISTIIEIDKQASLRLLMDPSSTDSLVVRGEAALSFTMDRSGKMSLTGAYNLAEGSYLVSLESILKRRFDIIAGSTIIWNGDPLDAEISLNAKYIVRASPYDLVATQMSGLSDAESGGYKQRYPFWVLLKVRGEILQPVISFEIQLPPEEKGILGGAVNQKLNMLNEDESALNKQVFALLVLGRFVQENPLQTESGGTSNLVRTTVGKFLSAQLNQLGSGVIPGMELNFDIQSYDDYQSGQAEGRTEVGIGVKQQLFNERLSVQLGGSVDVEGEKAKQNSANEITTDVTVELKLTEDGRFRLKGFRHNQYEGAIEGQLVETGAGIVYVRDFNKWKEFFRAPKRNK